MVQLMAIKPPPPAELLSSGFVMQKMIESMEDFPSFYNFSAIKFFLLVLSQVASAPDLFIESFFFLILFLETLFFAQRLFQVI